MTNFDLENFEKYLEKNPEKKAGKTWKYKEHTDYSEKKFSIEAAEYSDFGAVSETEKLSFNEEDLTESFFDEQNSLIRKVLKEYLKQKDQEEKSPKNITTTLIFSPLTESDFQPRVDSVDKKINFYCRGLNYGGRKIQTIILDAKNARDDVVGYYLVKKCLLEFDIYDEIEKTEEATLSFSYYRLSGFFRGSLTFKILKVEEGRNKTLKIEVAENLFNSSSKTLFLPKNNRLVEKTILSKKITREVNDEEIGIDTLETNWSEVEGKTFTIENINGKQCYFENDGLVLNDFEEIRENIEDEGSEIVSSTGSLNSQDEEEWLEFINWLNENILDTYDFLKRTEKLILSWKQTNFEVELETFLQFWEKYVRSEDDSVADKEIEELKKKIKFVFNCVFQKVQLEQELNKTKKLLTEKEQIIEKFKDKKPEEYRKEKEDLTQQLKQANQRIKELEDDLTQTSQELKELHDYAKNGSSSPNSRSNSFKIQLDELQQKQQEWKDKLDEEKQRNKKLEKQIKDYQNQNHVSSKTIWQTIKKPVLIGGSIAGGLLLLFIIYKKFIVKWLA